MLRRVQALYSDSRAFGFLVSMFIFGAVLGVYGAVLNNYLHEILNISRLERGIVELPRELPGLLLFLIIAVLYKISEMKILSVAMLVSLAGLIGLGFAGATRTPAIIFIVIFSTGEHMIMPIRSSIAIHFAHRGKEGLALGGLGLVANVGRMGGYYLVPIVFLLFRAFAPEAAGFARFRGAFFLAAGILVIGLLYTRGIRGDTGRIQRSKLHFRMKFIKYYILEVFYGARKQVFITFAPYVLIVRYGASTELIATLYGINSLANIFFSPVIGKLIDKLGYKKIIVADTIILLVLCLLYGFSHRIFPESTAFVVVCCVFIVDAILFLAEMARTVYVKSTSESQEEVTSTLSTGISINHLISIAIAVVGGVLWERLGMEVLFGMAALFAAGSFAFATTLPRPRPSGIQKKPVGG